jgi:type I restriction enzyme, S subunit
MTLTLDKSNWKHVAFGDVVTNLNVTVKDPKAAGLDRVIAMEHLDPGELKISRWGSLDDGTTFTRRVKPGQTLFGKRRAYQRKAAFAEFNAICSSDILVFEADKERLLPEFLPFIVQSNGFYDHALGTSAGSLSPRTNWRDLANYEFDLPPLDEQKRLADLLWAVAHHRRAVATSVDRVQASEDTWLDSQYAGREIDHVEVSALISGGLLRLLTGPFGSTLSASEYTLEGVPVIQPSFIVDRRLTIDEKSFVSQITASRLERWKVRQGDIVFMRKRDVTRSALVTHAEEGWILGSDCILMRADRDQLVPDFVQAMLRAPIARQELIRRAVGTDMPGINERSLSALRLPVMSLEDQNTLVGHWREFHGAESKLRAELDSLANLRASLLADIFRGN